MKKIIEKSLEKSFTYKKYKALISTLLHEGKSTGINQSEALTNYSLLNDRRMKRLDKTIKLSEETIAKTTSLKEPQKWLLLTEGWCGDAAQNIPIINKIAEVNNLIDLRVVLRDDNEELMNLFLTNGSKSIPKLIVLDNENNVLNTWGPRPTLAKKMVENYKTQHGAIDDHFKKNLQVWYNKDKGKELQKDFLAFI